MESARIKLEANNCKNNNTKKNQQRYIEQRRQRLQYSRENNLQARHVRHEFERSEDAERAQYLQVEADALARHERGEKTRAHNDKVHDAPHAVQVGALMQQQASGKYFEKRLTKKYEQKVRFGFFLFFFFWMH